MGDCEERLHATLFVRAYTGDGVRVCFRVCA